MASTSAERSANMRAVRSRHTAPEMIVRRLLHKLGYRFRLHARDLPGRPDLVFRSRRKVIFVHGCFWHGHQDCPRARRPSSNSAFWNTKLDRNRERDAVQLAALEAAGWSALTVWGCEVRDLTLQQRLIAFLGSRPL